MRRDKIKTMTPNFDQIIKSIEQLPTPEQERIRRWLNARETSKGEENRSQAQAERSAKSLRWLDENQEKYSGRKLKALRYRSSNWSQTKSQYGVPAGGFRE